MQSKALYAIALVAGIVLLVGGFLLRGGSNAPTPEHDMSLSHATLNGLYVAAIAPETGGFTQGKLQSLVLTLRTPDGKPVEGATVAISGGMPAHGHGLPTSAEVTAYLGDGRYRVEGVKFSMTGLWELRFAVSAPAGNDEAVFNLVL